MREKPRHLGLYRKSLLQPSNFTSLSEGLFTETTKIREARGTWLSPQLTVVDRAEVSKARADEAGSGI